MSQVSEEFIDMLEAVTDGLSIYASFFVLKSAFESNNLYVALSGCSLFFVYCHSIVKNSYYVMDRCKYFPKTVLCNNIIRFGTMAAIAGLIHKTLPLNSRFRL